MTNRVIEVIRGQNLDHIGTVDQGNYGLAPYIGYNGSTNYSRRLSPGPLKGLDGFTVGGWFQATSNDFLMGVWNTSATRSWKLHTATLTPTLSVSNIFAGVVSVAGAPVASAAWFHIVGRYTPSTELAIFVNGVKAVNTTSIPSTLFNSTAGFTVGASNDVGEFLTGKGSYLFFSNVPLEDGYIAVMYGISRHLYG